MNKLFTSLNGGELSPLLTCRHDTDKRDSGCKTLENFIVLEHGGITKRPGLRSFDASALPRGENYRLVAFEPNMTKCFVLVFCRKKILVFDQSGRKVNQLTTYWGDGDLERFQFCQVNDVLWVFHPNSPVYHISWHGGNDFRWELFQMKTPPWEAANGAMRDDKVYAYCSTRGLELSCGSPIFKNMQGIKMRVSRKVAAQSYEYWKSVGKWENMSAAYGISTGNGFYWNNIAMRYPLLCQEGMQFYRPNGECWRCVKTFPRDVWNNTGRQSVEAYPEYFQRGALMQGGDVLKQDMMVQGGWRFQTYGNWRGTWDLQRAENLKDAPYGLSWESFHRISSSADAEANYNLTGEEEEPVMFRLLLMNVTGDKGVGNPKLHLDTFSYSYTGVINNVSSDGKSAVLDLDRKIYQCRTPLWDWFETSDWSFEAFRPDSGYAGAGTFHQGRLWLGGNRSKPQTIWGSRVDDFSSFKAGTNADDGMMLTILSQSRDRILWMGASEGLMVGTESSEWSVAGQQGKAIGPGAFDIKRQSGDGSTGFQPLMSSQSLIFVKQGASKLLELTFSFQKDGWVSEDLTLLAEHITKPGIKSYTVQRLPWNIVWCVLNDGTLAGVTYNRAQNVVSWHRHKIGDGRWKALSCCVTHDPLNDKASGYDALWLVVEKDGEVRMLKMAFDPGRLVWQDAGENYESKLTMLPIDTVADNGHTLGRDKRISKVAMRLTEGSECLAGTEEGGALTPVRFDNQEQGWVEHVPSSGTQYEACFELLHAKAEPFTLIALDIQWEVQS